MLLVLSPTFNHFHSLIISQFDLNQGEKKGEKNKMATSTGPKKTSSSTSSSSAPDRPPQAVKFARRTSSGRVVSLSREDDLDMSGEFSGPNDYINYTVMMPPTPDNQPAGSSGPAPSGDKPDGPGPYGPTSRFGVESHRVDMTRRGGGEEEGGGGKLDRRMSLMKSNNKSMLLRSQTGDFDHNRWLFETKGTYGIGNAYWQDDENSFDETGMSMSDFMDKPWKPLTRKVKISAAILSPYRCKPSNFYRSTEISSNVPRSLYCLLTVIHENQS